MSYNLNNQQFDSLAEAYQAATHGDIIFCDGDIFDVQGSLHGLPSLNNDYKPAYCIICGEHLGYVRKSIQQGMIVNAQDWLWIDGKPGVDFEQVTCPNREREDHINRKFWVTDAPKGES